MISKSCSERQTQDFKWRVHETVSSCSTWTSCGCKESQKEQEDGSGSFTRTTENNLCSHQRGSSRYVRFRIEIYNGIGQGWNRYKVRSCFQTGRQLHVWALLIPNSSFRKFSCTWLHRVTICLGFLQLYLWQVKKGAWMLELNSSRGGMPR